jgi:hypothetical protein
VSCPETGVPIAAQWLDTLRHVSDFDYDLVRSCCQEFRGGPCLSRDLLRMGITEVLQKHHTPIGMTGFKFFSAP